MQKHVGDDPLQSIDQEDIEDIRKAHILSNKIKTIGVTECKFVFLPGFHFRSQTEAWVSDRVHLVDLARE